MDQSTIPGEKKASPAAIPMVRLILCNWGNRFRCGELAGNVRSEKADPYWSGLFCGILTTHPASPPDDHSLMVSLVAGRGGAAGGVCNKLIQASFYNTRKSLTGANEEFSIISVRIG